MWQARQQNHRKTRKCSVGSTKSMADLQKDNERCKQQLKSPKAALVTTISEGNESDLSDFQRSHGNGARQVSVPTRWNSDGTYDEDSEPEKGDTY